MSGGKFLLRKELPHEWREHVFGVNVSTNHRRKQKNTEKKGDDCKYKRKNVFNHRVFPKQVQQCRCNQVLCCEIIADSQQKKTHQEREKNDACEVDCIR